MENVTILAGYPDLYFNESYWEKKYSVLDLDPMSYMENVLKIQRFNLLEAAYELQSSAKKSHVFDLLSAKKVSWNFADYADSVSRQQPSCRILSMITLRIRVDRKARSVYVVLDFSESFAKKLCRCLTRSRFALQTTAFYMESLNAVFVHAGLMQEPYYHDDYPK